MMYLATAINDRDKSLLSGFISLFTWSKAYHSEIIFSDGMSLVCTPKIIGMVQRDSFDFYKWALTPLPIDEAGEKEIREEVAKILETDPKYDYLGAIVGRIFRRVQSSKRWYCSELCGTLLNKHMDGIYDGRWLTPAKLWRRVADKVNQNPDLIRSRMS